ncbi:DUF4349 domain-containing protein [Luteimonas aquatica]|uniref:DUF4349 domain-containing protein n=1 Tax=Luteimonas aquatica TaxID=450364 RepID=UPI001F59ED1A|nr:DUF4349 domain-containing protein [Luteimonas aquatica]
MQGNLRTGLLLCCLTVALGACARQESSPPQAAEAAADAAVAGAAAPAIEAKAEAVAEPMQMAPAALPPLPSAPPVQAQLQSSSLSFDDGERKFIRTANAQFRVKEVYGSALAIEDLAARHGGFVTRNDIRADVEDARSLPGRDGQAVDLATYTLRADLQVRVPSARTQEFLRAMAAQVEFLDRRNFAAQDAQFDLLRQKLAFARQQQAQGALGAVADGTARASARTEAIHARSDAQEQRDEALIAQKTFEDRVAFSTIDLSLYQAPQVRRTVRVDVDAIVRQESPGFFVRLGHSMRAGWDGFLSVVVALAALWPLWLAALVAAVGLRRLLPRRAARGAQAGDEATPSS